MIRFKESELINKPMWYHERGLMQTATGYGKKLVTEHMVEYEGRKRRIYVSQYSNVGTAFIVLNGKEEIVDIDYGE